MKRAVTIDRLDLDLRGTDRATAEQALALLAPTLAGLLDRGTRRNASPHSPAQALADRIAAGLTPHLSVHGGTPIAPSAPKGD